MNGCAILAEDGQSRGGSVKYPVVSSLRHKGKTIELDSAREIITLYGINGDAMGNLSWDFVIDQILAYRKPPASREARTEPRVTLAFRVKFKTPEGQQFESRAGGIGGGSLRASLHSPLAPSYRWSFLCRSVGTNGSRRKGWSRGSALRRINTHSVLEWASDLPTSPPTSAIVSSNS
jgi:hypothetical protein